MAAALEPLLDEYLRYYDRFTGEQIQARVDGLLQASGNNLYASDESERAFWLEVHARVQRRTPFSVVRLGEGEGNVLFWGAHETTYPRLAAWALETIWLIMFGRPPGRREPPEVLAGMRRAVETADLLGIPWREDVEAARPEYILAAAEAAEPAESPSPDPATLIRAGCGYLAVWETLAQAGLPRHGMCVGSRLVHVPFLEIAQELLSGAGNVSLITCYPALLRTVEKAFGVPAIESLLIPPEGGSPTATADWHSGISRHLRDQDLEGRLFLVGAGIVGKGFCSDIKSSGGMAIDLGSMLDVWSGQAARPLYQTDEFVCRYALRGRACHGDGGRGAP